jgi:hypothetical protein
MQKHIDAWLIPVEFNEPPCCDKCTESFDTCQPELCEPFIEAEQSYNAFWAEKDEQLYHSFLLDITQAEAKLLEPEVYKDWKEMHNIKTVTAP